MHYDVYVRARIRLLDVDEIEQNKPCLVSSTSKSLAMAEVDDVLLTSLPPEPLARLTLGSATCRACYRAMLQLSQLQADDVRFPKANSVAQNS